MSSAVEKLASTRSWILVMSGACVALAGCAGSGSSNIPYATESFNVQPEAVFQNQSHRLGPLDVISVAVYRAPEVTGDYTVDGVGNIMVPLIGQMPVQGMTTEELAATLRQKLGAKYYVNPDVSVALKESSGQQITLDGSVNSPGVYPLRGPTTLMQAVAMAKGVAGSANLNRVVVFRQVQGKRMAAAFDLAAIRRGQMEDPAIYASDIVIVDGNSTRQALRDVISTLPIIGLFRPFLY